MKKKLFIIGAGQHAKIVIENAFEQNIYDIVGMVNFDEKEKKNKYFGVKVICNYKNLKKFIKKNKKKYSGSFFCIGIGTLRGNMSVREKIFNSIKKIISPANILNPKSHISKFARIGEGNLIEAFAKIGAGAKIGNNCVVESFSSVNHDQVIGDNVFLATNVAFAGKKIGSNSLICDGVTIGFKNSIGKNCVILDGTRVRKNIKPNNICFEHNNKFKILPLNKYIKK